MHPLTVSNPGAPVILHVTPHLAADQVGRTILESCQRLRREGWGAIVASSGGELERELKGHGVEHVKLPLDRTGPIATWRLTGQLTRLCKRRNVTIVHAHRRAGALAAEGAAKRAGAAFVGTVHDLSDIAARRPRRRGDEVLAGGSRVIAVSEHVSDALSSEHGIDPTRIRVVPPGVDTHELDPGRVPGPRVAALAERWGLGVDRRIVLLPGPMAKEQGHLTLMKAMAKLQRQDFVLLFLGSDDAASGYMRQIEALVRAGSWQERVRFAGICPDVPAALQLADVLVMPAQTPPPSARVVAQAQAMGRPVIVAGSGALTEAMMPAATGWVVGVEDVDELAWAIDRALSLDDDLKQRLALRARAFAAAEFGLDVVGRKLLAVYRELAVPSPA